MMSSPEGAPTAWGWVADAWGWAADDDDTTGDLIERLSADFASLINPDLLIAIVQQCFRDLDTTAPPSPEAVEELARQRLNDTTGAYAISAAARTGPAAGSSAYLTIHLLSE